MMSPKQEATLKELMLIIPVMVNSKFRKGDKEHKGDIENMAVTELLDNLSEELIDSIIYGLLAVKRLRELKTRYGDGSDMEAGGRVGSNSSDLSKT